MAEWKSVAEAADMLGVSGRRVRDLVESGALTAERVGAKSWLIDADAVRRRVLHIPASGRPLSAPHAWLLLAWVQHVLDGADSPDPMSDIDRQTKYRLRQLLSAPAAAARWEHWLGRRAERRRIWIHPGVLQEFLADDRVHAGGAAAAASLGLSYGGGPVRRVYVSAVQVQALADEYQFVDDADGDVEMMAVPEAAASLLSRRGPVPPAVALADLLESDNARERDVAARHLESMSLAAS